MDAFVTHDGTIHPAERHMMTDAIAIIRRMALDMRALRRETDAVLERDLIDLGWSRQQIERYGDRALTRMTTMQVDDDIAQETLGGAIVNMAASAVSAAMLLGFVICACMALQPGALT